MPTMKRPTAVFLSLVILLIFSFPLFAAAEEDVETGVLEGLTLDARAAVVMDADTGRVIYGRYANRRIYPASTTKVLTLLVALEKYADLDAPITVPAEANQIPSDSTRAGITAGDKLTFRDLLYALMLPSGNDAANAIAVLVSGSTGAFVEQMNARAAEIGCVNTHFANAHGYHDENHYSTAYDMALIAREAMENALFRDIVATVSYTMVKTDSGAKKTIRTTNMLIVPDSQYYYEPVIGIKTGTHSKAGNCFIGAAVEKDKLLITTVMNSSSAGRWTDTTQLLKSAYALYDTYSFTDLYQLAPRTAQVNGAHPEDEKEVTLLPQTSGAELFAVTCLEDEVDNYLSVLGGRIEVQVNDLRAPVEAGQIVGALLYTQESGERISIPLAADRAVREAPKSWAWVLIVAALILILLAAALIGLSHINARNRKKKRRRRPPQRR